MPRWGKTVYECVSERDKESVLFLFLDIIRAWLLFRERVYICKWPMVLDNINNKCRLSSLLLLERVAAAAAASLFTYFIYSSSWAGSGTAKCDPSTGNLLKISFLTKGTSEPRRARAVPAAAPQMARLGALLLHAEIVCERDQRFFSPCLPGTQINLRAQELFRSNEAEVGSSDDLGNGHRYF